MFFEQPVETPKSDFSKKVVGRQTFQVRRTFKVRDRWEIEKIKTESAREQLECNCRSNRAAYLKVELRGDSLLVLRRLDTPLVLFARVVPRRGTRRVYLAAGLANSRRGVSISAAINRLPGLYNKACCALARARSR